ncbi:helix-turn-helix domain-containing protein [Sphingobium scionense]|uniref:Transcriptional regulator with XRE-family HTH domain n=1 Tax=Sphingobium scionense TaxID=1404341 RepID=A0A7W6PXU4_9SPHN|nr:helix-turn-helix transcriptional regulator [Sphingobium scionense]MBB4150629.1 transcriptional regulator with XRE-family HTH domain [Sphingobium scionense]MBB4150634.1 transcriptional regulator with XRE-family HTH domain [Sphingobium scionense]
MRQRTNRQLALDLTMSPDERHFFEQLGKRIAQTRQAASLTQQQVADSIGIPQPQYASYEVGRRRVPVSMLPRLARIFKTTIDALIGDDASAALAAPAERRTRRGPPSRIEQQLDAIAKLPKASQKAVSQVLDAMLAQHATVTGQEVAAP